MITSSKVENLESATRTAARHHRVAGCLEYQRLETVLLIEDDRDLNELLARRFRVAGLNVAKAFDGAAGLDKFKRLEPDAVVLDLGLPRMDGMKVLHNLRMTPGIRPVPVIVVTGTESEALLEKVRRWGVSDVLRKPVSPRALLAVVVDALEGI